MSNVSRSITTLFTKIQNVHTNLSISHITHIVVFIAQPASHVQTCDNKKGNFMSIVTVCLSLP